MKNIINKLQILVLLLFVVVTSCDNYERTEVQHAIFVNHQSLNLFVGGEQQLIANPTEGGNFSWTSTDESVATVSNGLVKALKVGTSDVVAERDGLKVTVPVTVIEKVLLQGIELSSYYVEVSPKSTYELAVKMIPLNANDVALKDFNWWSDNEDVARVNQSGDVLGVKEGITKIHYRKGSYQKDVQVVVSNTRPFKGPHIITAAQDFILPFRDFDIGGEGYAFHESDSGNSNGNDNYRKENGDANSFSVDIEGGNNVGWTANGEWLLYTVEVQDAGTYLFQLSESGGSNGFCHLEVDDENVTGSIDLPTNGSWSNWKWMPDTPVEIKLTEGTHKLRFVIDQAGFNMKEMKFEFKE
ncbi:MAG: Ig-like domain-containing protein [Bacteroidales bacterium]|nr:Ig-like domain-containing protein [Bacteroidales bacterium]